MATLFIEEAISLVHDEADEDANIIFGTVYDENSNGEVKITVIATGFDHHVATNQIVATPASPVTPATPAGDAQAMGQGLGGRQSIGSTEIDSGEDLDVPTFIRRQAD